MQREIKFRAWDTKENKWALGYDVAGAFNLFGELHVLGYLDLTKLQHYAVMQFTGLLDKNGREIYEGDIVRGRGADGEPMTWQVAWEFDPEEITGFNVGSRDENDCEIVGNIYENPRTFEVGVCRVVRIADAAVIATTGRPRRAP